MTAKHTPGPWTLLRTEWPRGWHVEARDGTYTVAIARDGSASPANEANARLIAAAPELLEALNRVIGTVEHAYHTSPDPDGSLWADVLACRSAIAKATGGAA